MRYFILPVVLLLASPITAQTISGTASVIDGDTIEIHGERIRLHGIDAVEGRQNCKLPDGKTWLCGADAALALSDRIGRKSVSCEQQDIDRYGRIVAICTQGGEDLGAWMVAEGWAMAYRQYSTAYVGDEARAEAAGRGLWVSEFLPPWDWRKAARGN
jgi:endonuclease YncB( thermonuclease family)